MPRGAKEKCTKELAEAAYKMRKDGLTIKEIATCCAINPSTANEWLHHPKSENQVEFSKAIKKAEADLKRELVNSIRAAGIYNRKAGVEGSWQADAWLLERMLPMEFSLRDQRFEAMAQAEERAAKEAARSNAPDMLAMIGPEFLKPHQLIVRGMADEIWAHGGRGSLKSSWASLEVIDILEKDPEAHAVVLMKYKNSLRDGAYAQVVWAIKEKGLEDDYDMPETTLRIKKKSTGQLIIFRGCDNPKKMKSVKVPFGYVKATWFEEADMFKGLAEIRTVNQSSTRGTDSEGKTEGVRMYTYNPPRSKACWINEHVPAGLGPRQYAFASTYLEAPPEWLGGKFLNDAELLRDTDPEAYRHEYLGEIVGNGTDVFDRVEFREITDEEIAAFDNPKVGQDFGWYPDPWALTVSEWRQAGRTILTYAELGGNKLHPGEQAEQIAELFERLGLTGIQVASDDADPQSIAAQRDFGINARKANKGQGRDASYKFLQSARWVIDPARCPNLAREVRAMQYETSKDGEVLNSIPDGNDHWVDATRYAIMRMAKRGKSAYRGYDDEAEDATEGE